jgi:hypothetical protein
LSDVMLRHFIQLIYSSFHMTNPDHDHHSFHVTRLIQIVTHMLELTLLVSWKLVRLV